MQNAFTISDFERAIRPSEFGSKRTTIKKGSVWQQELTETICNYAPGDVIRLASEEALQIARRIARRVRPADWESIRFIVFNVQCRPEW